MLSHGTDKPPKLPISLGDFDPIKYMAPWAHISQTPKRHLDRFSRFCRAHESDQQTDTHSETDRPRYSICSKRPHLAIDVMRPNNNKWSNNFDERCGSSCSNTWNGNSKIVFNSRWSASLHNYSVIIRIWSIQTSANTTSDKRLDFWRFVALAKRHHAHDPYNSLATIRQLGRLFVVHFA